MSSSPAHDEPPKSPALAGCVALAAVIYAAALGLVLLWAGWSVRKHGWARRSLRRFSYLLFILLLATRLAWCILLLARLHADPDSGEAAVHSAAAVTLSHLAFCLHFLAFSMLVCGWADSTYMMMAGRSLQPTAARSPTIFYHLGTPFLAVNLLNAAFSVGTVLPLLWLEWCESLAGPTPSGAHQLSRDALWVGRLARGGFSLLLAVSSTAAGLAVSFKIRDIADVEPALRSYAHAKMVKVALAAAVFCICSLIRAWVALRETAEAHERPLSPLQSFGYGVAIPELLPTFAALVVLRRRSCDPTGGCAPGWCDGWCERWREGCGPPCRPGWGRGWERAWFSAWVCLQRCFGVRPVVEGVDTRPLTTADDLEGEAGL